MNPHGRAIIFGFLISTASLATIAGSVLADDDSEFNERGNYLIADQFNNRVIEVDRSGKIVWHFGKGPADFSRGFHHWRQRRTARR
jgi:hypothetical protein